MALELGCVLMCEAGTFQTAELSVFNLAGRFSSIINIASASVTFSFEPFKKMFTVLFLFSCESNHNKTMFTSRKCVARFAFFSKKKFSKSSNN